MFFHTDLSDSVVIYTTVNSSNKFVRDITCSVMMTKIFSVLLIFSSLFLHAAVDLSPPLKMVDLIHIAMENHPETRQMWWNAKRAAAALGQAKSGYYPSISANMSVSNGRDFKFINGPDTSYTILGADLILSMMLYDFGERDANAESARQALVAAGWQSDWTLQKVLVQVFENAYALLHAQETMKAAKISLEEAEFMDQAARQLNKSGLVPITDVYMSQSTLAQMQMDLIEHQSALQVRRAQLAASLGLAATTNLELASCDQLPLPPKRLQSDMIAMAMQQRADLMAKRAQLVETRMNEKKVRVSSLPKLSATARGGANHYVHDKANAAQYQVTLNLDVPLFEGFDYAYQRRMAYADSQMASEELSQLELDIALEVLTYSQALEASQEMLPYAEEHVSCALKAYEGVFEKYQAGKESMTEMSTALRQLAAARLKYSEVRTRLVTASANLAYATGTLGSVQ
jgi:outer membrane protein TolC